MICILIGYSYYLSSNETKLVANVLFRISTWCLKLIYHCLTHLIVAEGHSYWSDQARILDSFAIKIK